MLTTQMRFQGCLIGLAVGDALGNATKFESPGSFTPITDLVGGGPRQPGGRAMGRHHRDGSLRGR